MNQPIAWAFEETLYGDKTYEAGWKRRVSLEKPFDGDPSVRNVVPLYAEDSLITGKDWRVVIDDTGGPTSGWPCVWSDSEDRAVIHCKGFKQKFWKGPTKKEAMEIAHLVADYMNRRST